MSAVGRKVLKRHTRVQAHTHMYTRTHGPPLPVDPHDAPSPAQGGPPAPTWNTQPPRGCSHRTLFSPRPPPEGRTLKFLLPGPLVRGKCAQSNARTPPPGEHSRTRPYECSQATDGPVRVSSALPPSPGTNRSSPHTGGVFPCAPSSPRHVGLNCDVEMRLTPCPASK